MSLYVCKCRCVMDEEKGIYQAVIRTKVYIGGSGIKLPVPWYIESIRIPSILERSVEFLKGHPCMLMVQL